MKVHVDSHQEIFDINAYLRGLLGPVVRFGGRFIHGYFVQNRHSQYAGWSVSPYTQPSSIIYGKAND